MSPRKDPNFTKDEIERINDRLFSEITNNTFKSERDCINWMARAKEHQIAITKRGRIPVKVREVDPNFVYEFTGRLKNGKQISKITVPTLDSPFLPNLWNGSVWKKDLRTGKRTLVERIYN